MTPFDRFRRAVDDRHGVADVAFATTHGVPRNTFYRRTQREQWLTPLPRVRVAPDSSPSVQRDLVTVCAATRSPAAASALTAAWLHDLRPWAPEPATFVVAHGTEIHPHPRTVGRLARWLRADDIVEVDGVPTLDGTATVISAAHLHVSVVRSVLIDATFKELTTPGAVLDRIGDVGPITGRGRVVRVANELGGHDVESIFQHDVVGELTRLGYAPSPSTLRIDTPDGRGLTIDVPLPTWCVAAEPEGDTFHRTRTQREADRRRTAAYAGTVWVPVPIGWRDWHDDREHVLDTLDAAIARQRQLGVGAGVAPPVRRRDP